MMLRGKRKNMKIIFSRKGFDSTAGGKPSPILLDGRMVSLPIPDNKSTIRYRDIRWQEYNLGSLVSNLTDGRIPAWYFAHLDPDINPESLSRPSEWRPIFGQTGAAQGHLRNNDVQPGDIFLFYGLFRNVIINAGRLQWDNHSQQRHVLWGWLQIDEILKIDSCDLSRYDWATNHPHFHRDSDANNTLYVARRFLTLPGLETDLLTGAGVFPRFSDHLMLTAPDAATHTQWLLPQWFYPHDGKYPLTYHPDMTRWQMTETGTKLNTVARGQEFILNTEDFPEAIEWLKGVLEVL
jgi:hypothetical protein